MITIVACWGIPALVRTHGEFLAIGIGRHVIGRSFGAMEGHGANSLGLYLLLSLNLFSRHTTEAFSSLRIEDYKNFLRMRIDPDGGLTIFPIGVQKAAKMAGDYGVTLGIEPINRFEIDLINTSEQCVRFVKEVGAKNVGVHLDTFHVNIEEKSFHTAITNAGRLSGASARGSLRNFTDCMVAANARCNALATNGS